MKTFQILGLLLTYPEGTIYEASDELMQVLWAEEILPKKHIKNIEGFFVAQKEMNILDAQEEYVATFDRGRAHALHLFEHIHGESRDRGQAMVDLADTYSEKGMYIDDNNELPDYLPLFLEFLSRCEPQEAMQYIGETVDVIAVIARKLKKRTSPYHPIFDALEALSDVKADDLRVSKALEVPEVDQEDLEALDKDWEEKAAFTGDPLVDAMSATGDCNTCDAFPNATDALQQMIQDTNASKQNSGAV